MSQTEPLGNGALYDPLVVKDRFIASMYQTLNNLGPNEAAHVRRKLLDMLGQWNPSLVASPEALDQAADFIFTDEILRDWISNTKFVFYMNIAAGGGKLPIRVLLRDIAIAASEDMGAIDMLEGEELAVAETSSAVPEQLLEDLPNASQAMAIFAANTWLVVPMLMFAFIDLDHDVLKTPEE
jgi:hypothetical protein